MRLATDDPTTQCLRRPGNAAPPESEPADLIPVLRVVSGPNMLRFAVIPENRSLVVGREATAHLVLDDASISRRHAEVRRDGPNFLVEDLGSTNGVLYNGRLCQVATLVPGDTLELGSVVLRIENLTDTEIGHLRRVQQKLVAAGTDPLTGLRNRRFLEEDLPEVLARHEAAGKPTSGIFIDVDAFKTVNDTFGHRVGDEVLQTLGRILLLAVRDADFVVRYGGEEILVILPGTSAGDAAQVAERLRQLVFAHAWDRLQAGLRLSVSCGVAERSQGETAELWIERADRALYNAKTRGRNRVEV